MVGKSDWREIEERMILDQLDEKEKVKASLSASTSNWSSRQVDLPAMSYDPVFANQ